MTISRRSMLHGLSALYALSHAVRPMYGLATGLLASPPDTNSIHLIFEGPWLIFPDPKDPGSLNALSLGWPGDAVGPDPHVGMVGLGEPKCGTLGNPQPVAAGQRWSVGVARYAPAPTFVELFSQPTDPFVWITGGLKVNPLATDRLVKFPMPDKFYVGGRLTGVTIVDGGSYLKKKKAYPHVASIFKYTASGSGPLSLSYGSGTQSTIGPGSHLVFRMRHRVGADSMSNEDHVRSAFTDLVTRIGGTNKPPVTLSTITSVTAELGSNTAGFLGPELGFQTGSGCMTTDMEPARARPTGPEDVESFDPGVPEMGFFTDHIENCTGGGGIVGP